MPCTLHCTPAVRTDDNSIPDDDADTWLAEPHLTESTCRADRCSDGGQFSAVRECQVRGSPQRRIDQRIHRRQTAVTRNYILRHWKSGSGSLSKSRDGKILGWQLHQPEDKQTMTQSHANTSSLNCYGLDALPDA